MSQTGTARLWTTGTAALSQALTGHGATVGPDVGGCELINILKPWSSIYLAGRKRATRSHCPVCDQISCPVCARHKRDLSGSRHKRDVPVYVRRRRVPFVPWWTQTGHGNKRDITDAPMRMDALCESLGDTHHVSDMSMHRASQRSKC